MCLVLPIDMYQWVAQIHQKVASSGNTHYLGAETVEKVWGIHDDGLEDVLREPSLGTQATECTLSNVVKEYPTRVRLRLYIGCFVQVYHMFTPT